MSRLLRTSLLLLAATAAAVPAQRPDRLRLATWNLEMFGFRSEPRPRNADDVHAIAETIAGQHVDVLAVQEIGSPEALAGLCAELAAHGRWRFVAGTTGLWNDGTGAQRVGVLWNDDRVELLFAEELLDLPREEPQAEGRPIPIFHRVPLSAAFRVRGGGLDFRLVTVHLKADNRRQVERHGVDELSSRKRVAEVTHLGELLARAVDRPGEDPDVVVLGDFNHPVGAPAYGVLSQRGRYLEPPPSTRTIVWRPEPIDHVVLWNTPHGLQEEVIAGSLHALTAPPGVVDEDWRATYSDHFPLLVELDASRDRDPDAEPRPIAPAHVLAPATAAVAAAAAPAADALAPGARVRVEIAPPHPESVMPVSYEGTLVQELGDWVRLRLDDGGHIAFPSARVLWVATVARKAH